MTDTAKTCRSRRFTAFLTSLAFAIFILLGAAQVDAQAQPATVIGANVQKIANSVLTLMGFGLTPDVTTGSLSFSSPSTGSPGMQLSSLGGGFTISKDFPLYLEGTHVHSACLFLKCDIFQVPHLTEFHFVIVGAVF
jgi:hypothetical protein